MASIKIITRSKKNPSPLYIRFVSGREIDFFHKINTMVNPDEWDNTKSNYKNLKTIRNRIHQHARFEKLKSHIIYEFNEAYMTGELITKEWLAKTVDSFFDRPVVEHNMRVQDHFLYYEKFVAWWLREKAPTWRTEKNKFLDRRAIQQYESFELLWNTFTNGKSVRIDSIDSVLIGRFVDFMESSDYSMATTKRHVGRLKFFLARAETEGIRIHPTSKDRTYYTKEDEIDVPYLNEDEIEAIFNLDLSHDDLLDNIRDNFIIGLWTGLRISDFNKNLDIDNIQDGYINIITQKTKTRVLLPIHPNVQAILDKRHGQLPKKYNDALFNKEIKTVCMLANIDNEIKGKIVKKAKINGKNTTRKTVGNFKKYKLITSHSCRRTFASIHAGKLPKEIIASLCGWSDTKMVDHYNKTTKKEHAEILNNHWKNKNYEE